MANGDSIVYVYGAGGNKLQKLVYENSSLTASTHFAGAYVYKDELLNYIQSAEGSISKTTSGFVYEYHLRDHIGNVRVAFIDDNGTPKVIQESDYYPFGLRFGEQRIGNDNKYLFSGKEQQDEVVAGVSLDWYDYGARMYSAELGRWFVVDAALQYHSPYVFVGNDPVNYLDPDGNSAIAYIEDDYRWRGKNYKIKRSDNSWRARKIRGIGFRKKLSSTIVVESHLTFYGGMATAENAKGIASRISETWNAPDKTVCIDGQTYNVDFKISANTVSEIEARSRMKNRNAKNNYIRLEKTSPVGKSFVQNGNETWNIGYWATDDNLIKGTTAAHEFGHLLGLKHPDKNIVYARKYEKDMWKEWYTTAAVPVDYAEIDDEVSIMYTTSTLPSNPKFAQNPNAEIEFDEEGYLGKDAYNYYEGALLNTDYRTVTGSDMDNLNLDALFSNMWKRKKVQKIGSPKAYYYKEGDDWYSRAK